MAIAVAAPLLAEIPIGVRLPVVILEMVLGIIIGPQVLGLAKAEGLLAWVGTLGLSALFFSAGMELDLDRVRGRPLSLAVRGWLLSFALGLVAAGILHTVSFIHAPMMLALALCTTAMGTILPILRDAGELETGFGRLILAAGAMGEFGPVVVMSLALTGQHPAWQEVALMLSIVALTFLTAFAALEPTTKRLVHRHHAREQSAPRAPFFAFPGSLYRGPVRNLRFEQRARRLRRRHGGGSGNKGPTG